MSRKTGWVRGGGRRGWEIDVPITSGEGTTEVVWTATWSGAPHSGSTSRVTGPRKKIMGWGREARRMGLASCKGTLGVGGRWMSCCPTESPSHLTVSVPSAAAQAILPSLQWLPSRECPCKLATAPCPTHQLERGPIIHPAFMTFLPPLPAQRPPPWPCFHHVKLDISPLPKEAGEGKGGWEMERGAWVVWKESRLKFETLARGGENHVTGAWPMAKVHWGEKALFDELMAAICNFQSLSGQTHKRDEEEVVLLQLISLWAARDGHTVPLPPSLSDPAGISIGKRKVSPFLFCLPASLDLIFSWRGTPSSFHHSPPPRNLTPVLRLPSESKSRCH